MLAAQLRAMTDKLQALNNSWKLHLGNSVIGVISKAVIAGLRARYSIPGTIIFWQGLPLVGLRSCYCGTHLFYRSQRMKKLTAVPAVTLVTPARPDWF